MLPTANKMLTDEVCNRKGLSAGPCSSIKSRLHLGPHFELVWCTWLMKVTLSHRGFLIVSQKSTSGREHVLHHYSCLLKYDSAFYCMWHQWRLSSGLWICNEDVTLANTLVSGETCSALIKPWLPPQPVLKCIFHRWRHSLNEKVKKHCKVTNPWQALNIVCTVGAVSLQW